ncbi:DegT/DnrJ/EryC1/StrS family aminotransferase [Aquihabitans sp. G128]|uniref:DegT/DnrJ/EryC1/StrS family aminotransferase n=1 Tax=Aquihabitans sp. G128 TaxID=2849779 RepID=UPI001C226D87|nr:DegT/DnrJ/EryC1/StrS family aminotransferase [Aquihabitans sp. G128]QXC61707.1 DegT/DnrJ/EryC1/StrS family aminotransferase [Aquihabitans sp. G128]
MTAAPPPVPLVDLAWQHAEVAAEVEAGFASVLARTAFVKGPEVAAFEEAFAAYTGAAHVVGVANGTDAVELALRACGVGRGDKVVLPANTFIATAEAVDRAGADPVLVDCDPTFQLIDATQVAAAVAASDARAVVGVDLFGQCAPLRELAEAVAGTGCAVVEDAAQSQGATSDGAGIGTLARIAGTSFYPGKNLGAYGDGGAVLTTDAELADWVRTTADHGSKVRYQHELMGMNSRLDTLQAVVLSAKLARLDRWNDLRRTAADRYRSALADQEGIGLPATAPGNVHVWHLFPVRVAARDAVLAELHGAGVGAGIHYAVPIHLQPAFAHLGHGPGDFPHAEAAAREIVSLPLFPGITAEQQDRVVEVLLAAVARTAG